MSARPVPQDRDWRWLERLAAVLVAALMIVVGLTPAQPAHAGTHDLTIIAPYNSRTLHICQNWTASTSTASSCTSGVNGTLSSGQNSRLKYRIADFDGIRVDAGYSLRRSTDSIKGDGDDSTLAGCRATTFWRKVSPSLFDPGENEDWYYLWNCPAY